MASQRLSEPVRAAIWQCLNQHRLDDAIFLSERLHAELRCDESLYLLATAYYRSGKLKATKILLNESSNPQCRYLLAKCCIELNDLVRAEAAITGNAPFVTGQDVIDSTIKTFGENASFALSLLGEIYKTTRRSERAVDVFQHSLRLNPCLWSSFEALVALGQRPDPAKIFPVGMGVNDILLYNLVSSPAAQQPAQQNVLHCKDNLSNKKEDTTDMNVTVTSGGNLSGIKELTPDISGGPSNNLNDLFITPQTPFIQISAPTPMRQPRIRVEASQLTPLTPMFGSIPVTLPMFSSPESMGPPTTPFGYPGVQSTPFVHSNLPITPQNNQTSDSTEVAPLKRTKKINHFFGQSTSNAQTPTSNSNLLTPRRSTRLYTSNSIKENTSSKTTTTTSPRANRILSSSNRTPNKKKPPPPPSSEKGQKSPSEIVEELNKANEVLTTMQLQRQRSSFNGLMHLLQQIAKASIQLSEYKCRQAIQTLTAISPNQFDTGFVLSLLGQAHFELRDYERCNETFEHMMKLFPFYVNGLELYSSSLWHKMQEKKLSYLAQTLVELDATAPQTLCALGNCFSRQKMHNSAVESLEKACKLHPRFQYAFTLLGHEYANNEELEKAMEVYRKAIAVNSQSYLVWSGLASVYMKQEQFSVSEFHWRKAIQINPENPTLLVHLGVALHQQSKTPEAIQVLTKAIGLEPKFALAKFHRATAYLAMDKCHKALKDLNELRTIAPHESMVYYLLGKVYKKLGKEHLALMNLSRATDMDPRGAYTQIKESIDPVRDRDHGGDHVTPVNDSNSTNTPHLSHHRTTRDLAREFDLSAVDSIIAREPDLRMEDEDTN